MIGFIDEKKGFLCILTEGLNFYAILYVKSPFILVYIFDKMYIAVPL